jgi:hypothetical protein
MGEDAAVGHLPDETTQNDIRKPQRLFTIGEPPQQSIELCAFVQDFGDSCSGAEVDSGPQPSRTCRSHAVATLGRFL